MTASLAGAILVALGTLVTFLAPVSLARPRFVSRAPMVAMRAWVVALILGASSTTAGLLLMVGVALSHHVTHESGHSVASGIAETIAGWIAVAIIGLLAFRIGAIASDMRSEKANDYRATFTLVQSGVPVNLGSVDALCIDSSQPFIAALPRHRRVVYSSGLATILKSDELNAAACHEQAHLDRHHSRLLSVARLAASSTPFVPASAHMFRTMRVATELDADDVAASTCGDATTAAALVAAFPNETGVPERVSRLLSRA